MALSTDILLYGLIALAAILLAEGLFYLFLDNSSTARTINRRMSMIAAGKSAQDIHKKLMRDTAESRAHLGPFGDLITALDKLLGQTGLTITVTRMLFMMGVLSLFAFAGLALLNFRHTLMPFGGKFFLIAIILALVVGVGAPLLYLLRLKVKQTKLFEEQLPEALDMMVRSLRVGHPVSVALALAAKQMPDPIGSQLGLVVDETNYGMELRDALEKLGDRVDVPDFEFVIVAISIQHDTGGNLAEVLNGLSEVIRSRFRMFKKVRALAAEGRFSAKILSVLPFAFAAFTFSAKPKYYLSVIDDPMFFKIALGALLMQVLGIFIMHKLINFRI